MFVKARHKRIGVLDLKKYFCPKSIDMIKYLGLATMIFWICACNTATPEPKPIEPTVETTKTNESASLLYPGEVNFKNLKQLTFGGDNAEAYFSYDNKQLVFQASNKEWGADCDQIYAMSIDGYQGDKPPLLSTGLGRTTCSFFMPDDKSVLYASTHEGGEACPPTPRSVDGKYVWPIYEEFDIYTADLQGKNLTKLISGPGYDAEATVSPDGKMIVFTSTRSGDLELYTCNIDGSNIKQVTSGLGYDGGAFFSPDSKKLVFRASRPQSAEDQKTYKDLLKKNVVQPSAMELFTCNVDGTNLHQVTKLGGANWAPYYHPDGKRILFASNHHAKSGRQFNIFMINEDGTGLKQLTFDQTFDSFPMFSWDGKKIVFSSNRNNGGTRDTNVFIADWVE